MSNAIIQAEDITAGYNGQNPILDNISLSIGKGEFVGIIGKNGAGKSTLLKALRGFLPVWSGRVLLAGREIGAYQERELAKKIAYLQQQVELTFDYTARDIVMAGRYPYRKWWQQQSEEDKEITAACMKYTGVLEMADKPIRALSGGQRQRVLLAKVLAQQTPVLFLDEPAAGLDLFYQEEIFRFCQELCHRGKTVVMVVHELNLAAPLDKDDLIIGYEFVQLGRMMEMIRKGTPADEALKKATGRYGRFDDAVKVIDPRNE